MSTLFIIATPIGNLSDITARAIETLNLVSVIYCEDTRTSSVLLKHYGIQKPSYAFHQHNEHQKINEIIARLNAGENVGLISDAGTPGISDPGFLAARAAHLAGHKVCAIPGASASLTALAASGLPSDRFVFEGFLPAKKGRKTRIEQLSSESRTIIFFESPFRIVRLCEELVAAFGPNRLACLCRELTKKFEEVKRMPLTELHQDLKNRTAIKGEIVLIVAGVEYSE